MLELTYTKVGVGLLEIGFLGCPTKMGGPKIALYTLIRDLGLWIPCANPLFQILQLSQRFWMWKEEVPQSFTQLSKLVPIYDNLTSSYEEYNLKEGPNPWFCPSLRDFFSDTSMMLQFLRSRLWNIHGCRWVGNTTWLLRKLMSNLLLKCLVKHEPLNP